MKSTSNIAMCASSSYWRAKNSIYQSLLVLIWLLLNLYNVVKNKVVIIWGRPESLKSISIRSMLGSTIRMKLLALILVSSEKFIFQFTCFSQFLF